MSTQPEPVRASLDQARNKLAQRADAAAARGDMDDPVFGDIRRQGLDEMRDMVWHSLVPARFVTATIDDYEGDVARKLNEWAHESRGRNLVLFGPVGTGKTHAAVAAVRPSHQAGLAIDFRPVVELLDALRPGGPTETFDELVNVERLVLDDLGAEKATEWTDERLYAVINRRWLEERPTVVTSNLEPKELGERIGPRAYSRLVGSDAVVVRLTGDDRRRIRRRG